MTLHAIGWFPQVDRLIRFTLLISLLRGIAGAREVAVQQTRRNRVSEKSGGGGAPTQYSRRFGWSAAYSTAVAATSGWKIGGTG